MLYIMSIKFILILPFLLLSACGFSPMYGEKSGSVKSGLDQVEILIIPDREGQYLRNALMDRFYHSGVPTNPAYKLNIKKINETIADFDITIESEATRRQLKLTTDMVLTDNKSGKTILTRQLEAITSHNVLESEFSTLVTEQSAREAALNDLARQIERQLALYFTR